MVNQAGSEAALLAEIGRALKPIGQAAKKAADEGDPEPLKQLMRKMGLDKMNLGEAWEPIKDRIKQIGSSWETIETAVIDPIENDKIPDLTRIDDVFEAIGDIFGVLASLDDISVPPIETDRVGELIIDYLLITYLQNNYTLIYALFGLLGVIRPEGPSTVGDLDLSRLGPALSNPNEMMASEYDWGSQSFEPYLVIFYLKGIVNGLGVDGSLTPVTKWMRTDVQDLGTDEPWPGTDVTWDGPPGDGSGEQEFSMESAEELTDDRLLVDVFSISSEAASAGVDLSVVPVPGKHGDLPGFAVVPTGFGKGQVDTKIDSGWTFNAEFSAEANWALRVRPRDGGGVDRVPSQGVDEEIHGEAKLTYDSDGSETDEKGSFGESGGTGVVIEYFQAAVRVDYDGEDVFFDVKFPITGRFESNPPGGFVSEVLPDKDNKSFDMDIGWSSSGGMYVERGETLEASIPIRGKIGPALLDELYVDLDSIGDGMDGSGGSGGGGGIDAPEMDGEGIEGRISFTTSISGNIEFGPVTARFKRMGVTAEQGDSDNPADVAVDFKFPDGVGISVDTDGFSGGGYLAYDDERERYAGIIQMQFADKFTLNVVGLLTTELPDGSDGFSLLLIISADDLSIQLGMGFQLEGLGGMVGINRSVKQRRIGNAIQTDSLGKLFFPESPIANADRIISDLGKYFPARRGSHTFGPVAKLTWADILVGSAGVIFEVPSGKFTLVGTIGGGLPDSDSDLIAINMAFSGYLDPPHSRIALDASLYDSTVIGFTLQGDMAMRTNWGDDPRFLLSIGGWNPRYNPPNDFPQLDRVGAKLGKPGGNARLELTGYLAITSNTFQVGAKLFALVKAGPAKAKGHLSFDALFQFSPFKFVIDFSASVSVTVKGKGFSITLDGTLMGPGPFRVSGTISIDILFITISVDVNATIGPAKGREQLPRARILPELTTELNRPANWTADRQPAGTTWATLRSVETDDTEVIAHPMSEIGVRQQIVPFNFQIEKFRNARPSGYNRFEITGVTSPSIDLTATLEEEFAPSDYTQMSNEEKMNAPAFESHSAGRKIAHEGIYCGFENAQQETQNSRTTEFGYECTVIDRQKDNWAKPLGELGPFAGGGIDPISGITEPQLQALTAVGAVAQSPARKHSDSRFVPTPDEQAAIDAQDAGAIAELDIDASGEAETATDGGARQVVRGGETPDVGGLAGSVSMDEPAYAVVDAETMVRIRPTDDEQLSKAQAQRALGRLKESHPEQAERLQVVGARRARPPDGGDRP
jgi:hypothetical protein